MADKARREELATRFNLLPDGNGTWAKRLRAAKCPLCGKAIDENSFKDELSRKEYKISHMCQKCQDSVFTDK